MEIFGIDLLQWVLEHKWWLIALIPFALGIIVVKMTR